MRITPEDVASADLQTPRYAHAYGIDVPDGAVLMRIHLHDGEVVDMVVLSGEGVRQLIETLEIRSMRLLDDIAPLASSSTLH